MRIPPSRAEAALLAGAAALLVIAWLGPVVAQPGDYHRFADQRMLWRLPMALDVLSNLLFALAGVAGLASLHGTSPYRLTKAQRAMATLFFAGLLCTAATSARYHLAPDEPGLMVDRCGMVVAFAGLLGIAAAGCVSERAGGCLGLALLLLGPVAAAIAWRTGNALPWALLQFGCMGLLLLVASTPKPDGALGVHWGAVVLLYSLAKLLEMNDHAVYEVTGHLLSGHTLKHAVAALAAAPVVFALRRLSKPRQNRASETSSIKTAGRRPAAQEET
ncbi:MAG: hypothetical protein JWQ33_825, partial [Ramlibacter sp.]|nr:hypothetical protein [Ramlibacter sp.]